MPSSSTDHFRDPALFTPEGVPELVQRILDAARAGGASDIHLVPRDDVLQMSWRIDGVLQPIKSFPGTIKGNVVSRLKVLAELLTYQSDAPQEGRIRSAGDDIDIRVSTFPTLFGEKAVIRLFVSSDEFRGIDSLHYPAPLAAELRARLHETGGVILITGPAGSGKTTTAYACLRELIGMFPSIKSVATLEDPIEGVIPEISQSQIRPSRGFDYAVALKSLLRQDPEVIFVGEIRDPETAELAFQAGLTGHLVLSTFHAGSSADAIARLLDMGIEPFQLRNGLLCVLNQRLVRQLCECAKSSTELEGRLGLPVETYRTPQGCESCRGTGYRSRRPLTELLTLEHPTVADAVLAKSDSATLESCAVARGMATRWEHAVQCVQAGTTSPEEIRRVLGFQRQ